MQESVMRYLPFIREASNSTGVPKEIIATIIEIESSGNPKAVGAPTKSGQARGLMQIMDFHWKDGEDPYDPETNIRKGSGLLAYLFKKWKDVEPEPVPGELRYGPWSRAVAAYFGQLTSTGRVKSKTTSSVLGITGAEYVAKFWRVYNTYVGKL